MIIKNIRIFTEEKSFAAGEIATEGGKIRRVSYADGSGGILENREREEVLDGQGCYAVPGMIDLHFHGCGGYDLCDGTKEALEAIAGYQLSIGVTAICPATMTLPVPKLTEVLQCAASYRREQESGKTFRGARLVGVNMEGPFISRKKKGAQDERYILPCDIRLFRRFQQVSDNLVRLVGIAPEEGDFREFIQEARRSAVVSLAHTNADYGTAMAAFEAGAEHVTHLYNAMTGFHHRDPGVVGAVFDSGEVTAELICDGEHVHPAAVRTAFREIGASRLILVSDSMRATGLSDGVYTLGGQDVRVGGGKATMVSDGVLAGSVTSLPDCVRCCVQKAHIPLEDAIACATVNPARRLGLYDERGSLTPGKAADIVLLDRELKLRAVIYNGRIL